MLRQWFDRESVGVVPFLEIANDHGEHLDVLTRADGTVIKHLKRRLSNRPVISSQAKARYGDFSEERKYKVSYLRGKEKAGRRARAKNRTNLPVSGDTKKGKK